MSNRTGVKQRRIGIAFTAVVIVAVAALVVHQRSDAADKPAAMLPLQHVADIQLSGQVSRLDYESLDLDRHLLFIAHRGDSEL